MSHNALVGLLDVHSLTEDTVSLMEASFRRVAEHGADFAEAFYQELFARYPGVKPLFANTSMTRQRGHLLGSLVLVIDNLRAPDTVEATLHDLGRRHLDYGVVPSYYYAVTSTLLDILRDTLGDEWTDALHDAWSDGLQAIADVRMSVERAGAGDTRAGCARTEAAPKSP